MQVKGLSKFFKKLEQKSAKTGKKTTKIAMKNPGRALEIVAKISSVATSKITRAALSNFPVFHTFINLVKIKSRKFCLVFQIDLNLLQRYTHRYN